jgi:hypothetical protein
MPAGRYQQMGTQVEKEDESSGWLAPYLAGSNLKLCEAINNTMQYGGATLGEAITMASTNPARLLKLERTRFVDHCSRRSRLVPRRRDNWNRYHNHGARFPINADRSIQGFQYRPNTSNLE